MRKIELRISNARKKSTDTTFKKRVLEIDRDYSHIKLNHLTFPMMRQQEQTHYFQIYAEWMKRRVRARKETYLDAFKSERVIPNDADSSEMSSAFQDLIDEFTSPLPTELSVPLEQFGRMQVIEDARRDIELFAQRMSIEQMRADVRKPQLPGSVHYNIHIGENRAPIQQGGSGNSQSINRNDHEK